MRDEDERSNGDQRPAAAPGPGPRGLGSCVGCQGVFPHSRMVVHDGRTMCGDCARRSAVSRGDGDACADIPARSTYDARMVSASVVAATRVEDGTTQFAGRYYSRTFGRPDDPAADASRAARAATPPLPGAPTQPPAAPAPAPPAPERPAMSPRIIPGRSSVIGTLPPQPEPEIDENDPESAPRVRSQVSTGPAARSAAATELPPWARPLPGRGAAPVVPANLPNHAATPPAPRHPIGHDSAAPLPSLSRSVLPPWEQPLGSDGAHDAAAPARASQAPLGGLRRASHVESHPGHTSHTGGEPRRRTPGGDGDRFTAYADLRRRIDGGEDTLETRRAAAEAAVRLSLQIEAVEHAKRCLELAPDDERMRTLLENVRVSMGLDVAGGAVAPAESPRRHAEEARPFWHDLGSAMSYPLRGQGLPVLLVGGVLIGLGQVIASVNVFAWTVSIMIWGYVSAYLFDVINSTGSGKTAPPEMPEASNILESYVFPFFATLTCAAVSFVPFGLAVYVAVSGWVPPAVGVVAALVAFAAGFFVFPMTLTVRAMFQTVGDAANPRVVFGAIGRIFPDYLAMFIATCLIWIGYGVAAMAVYALCWFTLARPDASAVLRADVAGIAAWVLHTVLSWPLFLYALMLQGHLLGRMYRQGFKRLAWFVPPTEATRTARKMSVGLGAAALVAFAALAGAAWAAGRAFQTMAAGPNAAVAGTVCPIGDGAHLTYFWESTDGMAGLTEYRFARQADGTMRVTASTRIAGQAGAPTDETVGSFDPDTGIFTDAVPSWGQGVHFDGKTGRHVTFYGPKRASIGSTYMNDWSVRGADRWQATWPCFRVHDDESTTDFYYDSVSGVLVGSSFKGVGFVVTEWLVDSAHVVGVTKGPAANRDFSAAATGDDADEFYIPR